MMTTLERRHSERARIPCNIPVELTDASRSAQFEADAVDLSVGGLSLRAARLPDLGSTLFCSFEAMPGGAQVLGRGEVVWRQASVEKEGGEFGLRFVEVDAKNQALIDEMVAERIARIDTAFTQPEPVIANLEIENVNAPVAARLVHNGENDALFEQPLDLLALGKGVVAHAGVSLLRGNIASVGLRMDGQTPMLSIRLKLTREGARFGEFEWGEPGSDTDPDVFGSSALHDDDDDDDDDEDEESKPAGLEASASELDDSGDEDDEDDDDEHEDADESEERDSVGTATLQGVGSPAPVPAPILARADESAKQLPLQFRRESAHTEPELGALKLSIKERGDHEDVFADEDAAMRLLTEAAAASASFSQLPEAGDEEEHDEDTAVDDPANSLLVRILRVFAAVQALLVRAREHVQAYWLKLRGQQGPRIAAGSARGLFGGRTRKVIAASARTTHREPAAGKSQRLAGLAIAVGVVTLIASVFMLMPSKKELPEEAEQAPRGADSGAQLVSANPAAAIGDGLEGEAPNAAAPSGSPYAVDVRAKSAPVKNAPAKPAAVSGSAFGAKSVPNGKRFVLRMRDPVKSLQGTAEPDGFSVLVNGNKALDKAAGLKTQPSVGGAAIWNRKDTVELHVRFAPGKNPAYRVTANGPSLEVVIGP